MQGPGRNMQELLVPKSPPAPQQQQQQPQQPQAPTPTSAEAQVRAAELTAG